MKRILLILAGSLIAFGLISGCNHHATPEQKLNHIAEEINDELDLNAEQLVKLNNLKTHLLELQKNHKTEKEQHHKQLQEILAKPHLDQQSILSHISEKTAFINEKAPEVVALLAGFYDSLSEDQHEKIRQMADKHHKRHVRWHSED